MIPEFSAAYQSLSTILRLAKAVHDAADQVEKNRILLEMQGALLELQGKLSAMQEKMDELAEAKRSAEAKLAEFSNWDKEADKYQLVDLARCANVMALKPEHAASMATHWLCPNCFAKREKAFLQHEKTSFAMRYYKCARCGYSVMVPSGEFTPAPRVIR